MSTFSFLIFGLQDAITKGFDCGTFANDDDDANCRQTMLALGSNNTQGHRAPGATRKAQSLRDHPTRKLKNSMLCPHQGSGFLHSSVWLVGVFEFPIAISKPFACGTFRNDNTNCRHIETAPGNAQGHKKPTPRWWCQNTGCHVSGAQNQTKSKNPTL